MREISEAAIELMDEDSRPVLLDARIEASRRLYFYPAPQGSEALREGLLDARIPHNVDIGGEGDVPGHAGLKFTSVAFSKMLSGDLARCADASAKEGWARRAADEAETALLVAEAAAFALSLRGRGEGPLTDLPPAPEDALLRMRVARKAMLAAIDPVVASASADSDRRSGGRVKHGGGDSR